MAHARCLEDRRISWTTYDPRGARAEKPALRRRPSSLGSSTSRGGRERGSDHNDGRSSRARKRRVLDVSRQSRLDASHSTPRAFASRGRGCRRRLPISKTILIAASAGNCGSPVAMRRIRLSLQRVSLGRCATPPRHTKTIKADPDSALEQALAFAKSSAASYLPGWCGRIGRITNRQTSDLSDAAVCRGWPPSCRICFARTGGHDGIRWPRVGCLSGASPLLIYGRS